MPLEKLTADDRPVETHFEFENVELKKELITNPDISVVDDDGNVIEEEGYYESRKNEISFEWLNGHDVTEEEGYIWHANMPIALSISRKIFKAAKKGMPKRTVLDLVFPFYDLNQEELALFEMIYRFGKAYGVDEVSTLVHEWASEGDPRAVKLYYELAGVLETDAEEEEDKKRRLLPLIKLDI